MTTTVTTAETGPLTANGTAPLPFTFQALSATEIDVTRNNVVVAKNTYTVALNANGTGTVTPLASWGSDTVRIYSAPNYQQDFNAQRFVPFFPDQMNAPLDRMARTLIALKREITAIDTIDQTALAVSLASKADNTTLAALDARELAAFATLSSAIAAIPSGPPGTNGGIGSSAGYGGLFTAMGGTAIGAGITRIKSSGYSVAGLGGADYIYDAAVNGAFVTANPRTAFLAADGRGFRLDYRQFLNWFMFGVIPDYVNNANRGTDNYAAIMAALQYRPLTNFGFTPRIHAIGWAYSSQTIEPQNVFDLEGMNPGVHVPGADGQDFTLIATPTDVCTTRILSKDTIGESGLQVGVKTANGSRIRGVTFTQTTKGTNLNAHGVDARATVTLIDCSYVGVAGDGEHIAAWTDGGGRVGNANQWRSTNCHARDVGGNGHCDMGSDANAGVSIGFITQTTGLCGYYSSSYYPNAVVGLQITGWSATGVYHQGYNWMRIAPQGSLTEPPSLGAEAYLLWDRHAAAAGPSANFPQWVSGTEYKVKLSIYCTNGSSFIGTYIEGGPVYGKAHAPSAVIIGGDMGFNDKSNNLQAENNALVTKQGIGYSKSTGDDVSHPSYPWIGGGEATVIGQPDADKGERHKRRALLTHYSGDNALSILYQGTTLDSAGNAIARDLVMFAANGNRVLKITGKQTGEKFNRVAIQEGHLGIYDTALLDPTDANVKPVHGVRGGAPAGDRARGEFYWNGFNPSPAGGILGWSCTTGHATAPTMTPVRIYNQMPAQADSAAAPTQAEFNALLAKLRAGGFMAT